jgi:hypothetical protein
MKVIIPCFKSSYIPFVGDKTLFRHLDCLAAIALEAESVDSVVVASDDDALCGELRRKRVCEVVSARCPDTGGRSLLPPGSSCALRSFLAGHGNEKVLVVNWNVAGITPACFDQMAREVEAKDGTVCGLLSEKDNPCRYSLYRRLTDMDVVLGLQPASGPSLRSSSPVYWDNPLDISGIHFSCTAVPTGAPALDSRPRFKPTGLRADGDSLSASFLFDPSSVDGTVDSVNLFGSRTVWMDPDSPRSGVLKICEEDFPGADFLLVIPFDQNGFIPNTKQSVKPMKGKETLVPLAAPTCSGVAILSGNNISDGIYHSKMHFPAIDGVLRWEGNNAYNCKTGKLIHGRQEFPDIFRATGVVSGGYAEDMAAGVSLRDGPYGVPLSEKISLIQTQLDLVGDRMDCDFEQMVALPIAGDACTGSRPCPSRLEDNADLRDKLFAFGFLINKNNDFHSGDGMAEFNELRSLRDAVNAEIVNSRINALRSKLEPGRCNGWQ